MNNVVNIHIGSNAFDALVNTNQIGTSETAKLVEKAEKIRDYYEGLNKDFDPENEAEKVYRWALVWEPNKSPYFIELPMFGKYNYPDVLSVNTVTVKGSDKDTDNHSESSKALTIKAVTLAVKTTIQCPLCNCDELRKNGYSDQAKSNQRYICKSCNHRFKSSDLLNPSLSL